jgi:hypothetical protein
MGLPKIIKPQHSVAALNKDDALETVKAVFLSLLKYRPDIRTDELIEVGVGPMREHVACI